MMKNKEDLYRTCFAQGFLELDIGGNMPVLKVRDVFS
jgi:hypothetical protein